MNKLIRTLVYLIMITCVMEQFSCWNKYKFELLSAKLNEWDHNYADSVKLEVKKFNRTFSYLNCIVNVIKEADDIEAHVILYQRLTNKYRQSLLNNTFDICKMMDKNTRPPYSGLLMDVLQEKGFPMGCPVPPKLYNMSYIHFDVEKLPSFLLPAGRWKGQLMLYIAGKEVGSGEIVAEIKDVVSRKQLG